MRKICAWCRVVLEEGPEPVSHGLCGPCLRRELATIRDGGAMFSPAEDPVSVWVADEVDRLEESDGACAELMRQAERIEREMEKGFLETRAALAAQRDLQIRRAGEGKN